ncbi:MAG: hypothetical protein MUC69_03600, partial [Gemmatimonadales bacterium]|nr:hypothetical protein [Gemmatimonadales bacterium]
LVDRHIRAFDPVPGAWSTLDGTDVKCFGARAVEPTATAADGSGAAPLPGTVLRADDRLVVQCGRGAVRIDEVQPAGRKRQPVADWTRGRGVTEGQRFT